MLISNITARYLTSLIIAVVWAGQCVVYHSLDMPLL